MRYTTVSFFVLLSMQYTQANGQQPIILLETLTYQADTVDTKQVSKQKIESSKTLGDALTQLSGIQSSAFGPNTGTPVIRSLTGHRVNILENGQPINAMNAFSADINVPFDALFSETISVNKSPDTVRYGSSAIGGRVNIDTGLISRELEDRDHALDIILKKGFNAVNAKGFKLNINNQRNLSSNIQYSTQEISSYKIPGNSKASVCDRDVFSANGGVNTALSSSCQRDSRVVNHFNKAHHRYLDRHVIDDIARNPEHFYDYYDGEESMKYTDQTISKKYINGRLQEIINDPNPDYIANTEKYMTEHINRDVTPNYHKKLGNSYSENTHMALGSTYFLDHGYIALSADRKSNDYGVPGFSMENKSFQNSYEDGLAVGVKIQQNKYALESLFDPSIRAIDHISLKASRRLNTTDEYLAATQSNQYRFDQNFAELFVTHAPYKQLTGSVGLSASQRDIQGTGKNRYLPNVKTQMQAIFLNETLSLDRLNFSAGYRLENIEHEVQDQNFKLARNAANRRLENQDFKLQNYFLATEFKLNNRLAINLKYSDAQRAPEVNELYSSNPHYSVMAQEEGNQNLKKEHVQHLELGAVFERDTTRLETNLYQMKYNDFLFLSNSGASMQNRLPLKYWTQTDTEITGFEIDLSHRFDLAEYGSLKLASFADLVKNKAVRPTHLRLANDGVYLPNMPTNRYGASIEWANDDWNAQLSSIYYAKPQYLGKDVNQELPLPAYNLVELSLKKSISTQNAHFDLFLNGSNLLNQEARPQNSALKYIAPLPGRGFQLGISMYL